MEDMLTQLVPTHLLKEFMHLKGYSSLTIY
jgi:hypothetical protein